MKRKNWIEVLADTAKSIEKSLDEKNTAFLNKLQQAYVGNAWFVKEFTEKAIRHWIGLMSEENVSKWLEMYAQFPEIAEEKSIAVIAAGNIPMVGLHDMFSVVVSGHRAVIKLSSDDRVLMPLIWSLMVSKYPQISDRVLFTEEKLQNFDAVIATGSNNTSRYFEYYFGKYPNMIRKNKTAAAILDGSETPEDLKKLAEDVFTYFGLGCRSVSKLFVPEEMDVYSLKEAFDTYQWVIHHHKYHNNYMYNKSIWLLNKQSFNDFGNIMLVPHSAHVSPVSALYYERYAEGSQLQSRIYQEDDLFQCLVSKGKIPFGQAQNPHWWDYADGLDTMMFLLNL